MTWATKIGPAARPPARVRGEAARRTLASMTGWGSFSYAFGPVLAFGVVGVLALLLRWAFGHGRSLVERRPAQGSPTEYGLLVPVAEPKTFVEAELMRRHLTDAGLRATLAPTTEGPKVMVFPDDVKNARLVLRSAGLGG